MALQYYGSTQTEGLVVKSTECGVSYVNTQKTVYSARNAIKSIVIYTGNLTCASDVYIVNEYH